MNDRYLEVLLWLLALGGGVIGIDASRRAVDGAPSRESPSATLPSPMRENDAGRIAAAVARVERRNPFRLNRAPAVRSDPAGPPVQPVPAPVFAAPRPPLALAGIVGGPPWEALVEGLPGREGAVLVRAGDRIEDFHVVSVGPDGLVVQHPDTSWSLTLKQRWQ